MKVVKKTASQHIGSVLNSPNGGYIWNRLNLVMIVAFVGVMSWWAGVQWERAHYQDQHNWLLQECLQRLDKPIPEKLNEP